MGAGAEGSKWWRITGKIWESLTRFPCTGLSASSPSSLVTRMSFSLLAQEQNLSLESFISCFQEGKGSECPSYTSCFLSASNSISRMTYFGVTCSELLHHPSCHFIPICPSILCLSVCLSIDLSSFLAS